MLKYLIIPLADDAVSFCHYERKVSGGEVLSLETLRNAIFWAMKENLNVQFVYPDWQLPDDYKNLIETIDHANIVGAECVDKLLFSNADVVVFDSWKNVATHSFTKGKSYVIRTSKAEFFAQIDTLKTVLPKVDRIVIVITDIADFTDADFAQYQSSLEALIPIVKTEYVNGHSVQLNLLTDRLTLSEMNNCNAGSESITLAPDGQFYICPAFYFGNCASDGNPIVGLDIKNQQLFRLDHAPICRKCDAFQCRRCVWLNRKTTLEVNTPSHEQCVVAHIERNASKKLLEEIRKVGEFLPEKDIQAIDYLDPFDNIKQ